VCQILGLKTLGALHSIAALSLKPDAVVGRRGSTILDFALGRGFMPIAAQRFGFCRHSMRELWRYDWHEYPVDRLAFSTHWYTATDVIIILFRDINVVGQLPASVRLAGMKGSAIAEERNASDLRSVLNPPNRILNFVHVADEPADVIRELGICLDEESRRQILLDAKENFEIGADKQVSTLLHSLEIAYAEHDLDAIKSLARLEMSSALSADAAAYLRSTINEGRRLSWSHLCHLINPHNAIVDRWDFICLASVLIPFERIVLPLLPKVDEKLWSIQHQNLKSSTTSTRLNAADQNVPFE
jgi:hypothetical protein